MSGVHPSDFGLASSVANVALRWGAVGVTFQRLGARTAVLLGSHTSVDDALTGGYQWGSSWPPDASLRRPGCGGPAQRNAPSRCAWRRHGASAPP
jgi:hypothetical protein